MAKYNLSKIMKRAWKLVKKAGFTISEGLRSAWKEAKSLKEQLIRKLEAIVEEAKSHGVYDYEISINDWEKYGKSRTYFAVYETANNSKHNTKYDFGYFDNQTGEYFPAKYGNLTKNYTLSGARM